MADRRSWVGGWWSAGEFGYFPSHRHGGRFVGAAAQSWPFRPAEFAGPMPLRAGATSKQRLQALGGDALDRLWRMRGAARLSMRSLDVRCPGEVEGRKISRDVVLCSQTVSSVRAHNMYIPSQYIPRYILIYVILTGYIMGTRLR